MKQLVISYDYDETADEHVASIDDPELGKMVVSGESITDCLRELALSIDISNRYRDVNMPPQ